MSRFSWRHWLVDVFVGGVGGTIVAAIVAVNLVIYYGLDRGYESSFAEIFERSTLLGVAVVAILFAGPVLGVVTAHVQRMKRSNDRSRSH